MMFTMGAVVTPAAGGPVRCSSWPLCSGFGAVFCTASGGGGRALCSLWYGDAGVEDGVQPFPYPPTLWMCWVVPSLHSGLVLFFFFSVALEAC